jgi:hypothetical protein
LLIGLVRAEAVQNHDVPLVSSIVNPCNGETVTITGNGHEVDRVTVNGNTFHIGTHFDAGGVKGVGQTTGAKYSTNDVFNLDLNLAAGANETVGEDFHLIGQGQVPNFVLHTLFHITINANGDVTSSFDNVSAECR